MHTIVRKLIIFTLLTLVFGAAPAQYAFGQEVPDPTPTPTQSVEIIPGQYIVVLKDIDENELFNGWRPFGIGGQETPMTEAEVKQEEKEERTDVIQSVEQKPQTEVKAEIKSVLNGFVANLSPEALAQLQQDPRVESIEPDTRIRVFDSQFPVPSWGLDRIDQDSLPLDHIYNSDLDGSGVHVYVVDSGVRATHNEFSNGQLSSQRNFVGADTNAYNDCNGHGTHVAGSIAGNNYGVAKGATIHNMRVMDCDGTGATSEILVALDWIADNHSAPAVVNASLGGPTSDAKREAIQNLIDLGITVVVAAGNSAVDACSVWPADVSDALTVGATGDDDARWTYSNYGSCVDIWAPGAEIASADMGGDNASTALSGTSMAAPHVAGVAALYLQQNPTATPAQVATALTTNALSNVLTDLQTGSPNLLLNTGFLHTSNWVAPTYGTIVFEDNFETDKSWQINPNATDTATNGAWERAVGQTTDYYGVTPYQIGYGTNGNTYLVTTANAGDFVGEFDLDDGVTSILSPAIDLPADTLDMHLYFYSFFAHRDNASAEDYLRVSIIGQSTQIVLEELGAGHNKLGAWEQTQVDINAFAGQTVRIKIEANDTGDPSLLEAGVDDIVITYNNVSSSDNDIFLPLVVNTAP